ncbi:MAG: hypothetical protein ACWGP1_11415 [Syntrophobacteria bacterium]
MEKDSWQLAAGSGQKEDNERLERSGEGATGEAARRERIKYSADRRV